MQAVDDEILSVLIVFHQSSRGTLTIAPLDEARADALVRRHLLNVDETIAERIRGHLVGADGIRRKDDGKRLASASPVDAIHETFALMCDLESLVTALDALALNIRRTRAARRNRLGVMLSLAFSAVGGDEDRAAAMDLVEDVEDLARQEAYVRRWTGALDERLWTAQRDMRTALAQALPQGEDPVAGLRRLLAS